MNEIEKKLSSELLIMDNQDTVDFVFECCESDDEKKRMFELIKGKKASRKEIRELAVAVGIEGGTLEGELEDN